MTSLNLDPQSSWQSSLKFNHYKCLIICRGPIRLEAIKIFIELEMDFGILLSEKDSIKFPNTLAPELGFFNKRKNHVHHITDYMGDSKEDKELCTERIIRICLKNQYTHIFAGYGFMAEDCNFVSKIEKANINFIGPNSNLIRKAGSKDEAKKIARSLNISVIPGEDNITALTLLEKAGELRSEYFQKIIQKYKFSVPNNWESLGQIDQAKYLIDASHLKNIELFSISDLQNKTVEIVKQFFEKYPGKSIRFKHILGGGGKGQRVVTSSKEVPEAVMSVLVESKSIGVGANKNFLIELNLENIRHIEIQVIGNGEWCVELGGRDCSLQMHEQKLIECSLTEEMLKNSSDLYESLGEISKSKVIKKDLSILKSMCSKAEKFGKSLKLDSVSTFECIVDKETYYFMEVNTRIQVEHRVTEMAYKLKFTNPKNPNDYFFVNSLVGAMILIKCYGDNLPRPERVSNSVSGIEARINSTNASLNPHSGGIIFGWTEPSYNETRDDQGIGKINNFTGFSQPYRLSGAYDSNIALSITKGTSRKECFEKLIDIFREMEIDGKDLNLNKNFIYGILHWFHVNDTMLKPNTNFVSYYLAIAGKIKEIINFIDLEIAWNFEVSKAEEKYGKTGEEICEIKFTLILRPLKKLFSDIHLFLGWISIQESIFDNKKNVYNENPIKILKNLYLYLNLNLNSKKLPSDQIWNHDQKLLDKALTFYKDLENKFNLTWKDLKKSLHCNYPSSAFNLNDSNLSWDKVIASHRGHQLALDILTLPMLIAKEADFLKLKGNDFLEIEIPKVINNFEYKNHLISILSSSDSKSNNEISASSGGIFYARANPDSNDFVKEGQHVKKGQVLGLLEVMKMFNEIRAPSNGIILKKCFKNSGISVKKRQILFLIEPDEKNITISEEENLFNQEKHTTDFMKKISIS